MNIALVIILGWLVVSAIVVPILMRLPREKKRYARMDDRKLVETNTQARLMKRTSWLMACLSPLFFILVGSFLRDVWTIFVTVAAFLFLGCIGCARVFREMELLTTVEMDFRKFRAEKEGRGRESDMHGLGDIRKKLNNSG